VTFILQDKTHYDISQVKKSLFWRSRSSNVIEFGANRKPVYDFLLVSYWPKIANFDHPSHLGPSFGVTPFEFMEKLYGSWN